MKKVSLSGSPRENVGKKDAAKLRNEGKVPCVLYGGEKQVHFYAEHIDLSKIVFSPDVYFIELSIDGQKYQSIIKDFQFHPVTDHIMHLDFQQVMADKELKMELPVRLSGSSIGVRNGGRLGVNFRRLMVKGLPDAFPDAIEIDISPLKIGSAVRIKDIQIPGINILQNPEVVVLAVKRGRTATEFAEDEAAETAEAAATEAAAEGEAAAESES